MLVGVRRQPDGVHHKKVATSVGVKPHDGDGTIFEIRAKSLMPKGLLQAS